MVFTAVLLLSSFHVFTAAAQRRQPSPQSSLIPADDPRITLVGRYDNRDPLAPRFGYPGTGIAFRFKGSDVDLKIESNSEKSPLTLVVDHGKPKLVLLRQGENDVRPGEGLDDGAHVVHVYKRNETWQGILTFEGLRLVKTVLLQPTPLSVRKLMFLGDSVTCGAAVENNSTCSNNAEHPASYPYYSYGMVLGRRLDAQVDLVCFGGRGVERDYRGLGIADGVLNAPEFLDLSIPTDDAKSRAPWNDRAWTPDSVVVSLGTNDFYLQATRPLNEEAFVTEYASLLKRIVAEYPKAVVFVTEGPMVTDPLLRQYVQAAVDRVHSPHVIWMGATHYPGNGCNPHPTGAQHARIADDMEPVLRHHLHW